MHVINLKVFSVTVGHAYISMCTKYIIGGRIAR